jgi:hypothetical protein
LAKITILIMSTMRGQGSENPGENDALRGRLGGFTTQVFIPTLKGFVIGGVRLKATDPLADKDAFASKILDILAATKRTYTVQEIVPVLRVEGLAKDPKAISVAVSQALQLLKGRNLVVSGGRLWMASVHTYGKGGVM